MATQEECKQTVELKVNEYKMFFYQAEGVSSINPEGKEVSGYTDTVLNNITKAGDIYSEVETYSRGDIVSYLGNIYVCKLNATINKSPANSFYWEIKITETDVRGAGYNIVAHVSMNDGEIVSSKNIDIPSCNLTESGGVYNYRFNFLTPLNNDDYTVVIGNANLGDADLIGDLIPLHNIKNKDLDKVYFTFDDSSTHYKKFNFYIIET